MAFHVGQKVVCVDGDKGLPGLGWKDAPIKGHIYTICAVGLTHPNDPSQLPCVQIAEIWRSDKEPLWAHRFRPLTDRKSEVSFTMGADPESEKWDNRKVKVRS